MRRRRSPRNALWWALALGASAAVPLSSPWLGLLRDGLARLLGGHYADALAIGLAAVGIAALAVAVASIRTRRAERYGLLILALALVALQPLLWNQGIRRVDLVERIHLVEYAGIAGLYLLALRPRVRDLALPVLATLAAGLVGVADETIQWLSPARVGDIRDVLLDGWAGAIGALFVLALVAPEGLERRPGARSVRATRRLALVLLLAGAALFSRVGVGTMIHDPRAGAFVSESAPAELLRTRDARAREWALAPPGPLHPLGLEDGFLTEAGFHKAVRDQAATAGALRQALFENRILERWYTPYLDLRSFDTGAPNRWPEELRAAITEDARGQGHLDPGPYRSPALADRLRPVPTSLLWGAVLLAAAGLWGGGRWLERRLAAGKVERVSAGPATNEKGRTRTMEEDR